MTDVKTKLEILDIIKTHKLLNNIIKCNKYHLPKEELNKIKEWLYE